VPTTVPSPPPAPPDLPVTSLPTPPLPTLPVPTTGAQTTVVVNIPPELVNRLNPPLSFPSPGWATIIAALIALCAAGIAFCGVMMQVRATAREQQRNREADIRRAQRIERAELLVQAAREANELWDAFVLRDIRPDEATKKLEKASDAATLTTELLRLAGLPKSADALTELSGEVLEAWRDPTAGVTQMCDVVEIFRDELANP